MLRPFPLPLILAAALAVTGCAPALDWREFVPEGSGIHVAFPCRPDRAARPVSLAGSDVRMEMLSCSASGMTFALGYVDAGDPGQVAPLMAALRASAVANIRAQGPEAAALAVPGMTPNPESVQVALRGQLPDGGSVGEHAAFFARGLRVYQASVIGGAPTPGAVDTFISSLSFPP